MNKHTPRPWKVFNAPHSRFYGVHAADIAIGSHMANTADAKLIAAAPDMAEALSQVMQMIGCECDCIHSDASNPTQCPCKLAYAALAKAGLT